MKGPDYKPGTKQQDLNRICVDYLFRAGAEPPFKVTKPECMSAGSSSGSGGGGGGGESDDIVERASQQVPSRLVFRPRVS